jgi:hypothetical protein
MASQLKLRISLTHGIRRIRTSLASHKKERKKKRKKKRCAEFIGIYLTPVLNKLRKLNA